MRLSKESNVPSSNGTTNEPNLYWETDLWVRKSDLMIVKFRREMRFDGSAVIEEVLQKNIESY